MRFIAFLMTVSKYLAKSNLREGGSFGSRFEGNAVHHSGGGGGGGGAWSEAQPQVREVADCIVSSVSVRKQRVSRSGASLRLSHPRNSTAFPDTPWFHSLLRHP